MSSVRSKTTEDKSKKTLNKKKSGDNVIAELVEKSKVVDKTKGKGTDKKVSSDKKKTEKVTSDKIKKEKKSSGKSDRSSKNDESKDEKKEKIDKPPKKINVKPAIADIQGLNLSVAKARNIISNLCINKETTAALSELRELKESGALKSDDEEVEESDSKKKKITKFTFSLEDVSESTLAYLDECQLHVKESLSLAYSRKQAKELSKEDRERYDELKKAAEAEFNALQKKTNLFSQDKFDLIGFNESYNSEFYDDMTSFNEDWKSLENEELYNYCIGSLNKSKIRFNSESMVFITALVEYIIKQLVTQGTLNCVSDGKKIIQLNHAVEHITRDFKAFPIISNTHVYKRYLKGETSNESEADDSGDDESHVSDDDNTDDDNDNDEKLDHNDRKLQFKYYVTELCRNVRMEISKRDKSVEDDTQSKYNQTSVSKDFKQFCSEAIIELLQIFGRVLKTEVITRDIKTVNYAIISALIHNVHTLYNLDSRDTISFIQEKYNINSVFLKERQEARAVEAAAKKAAGEAPVKKEKKSKA